MEEYIYIHFIPSREHWYKHLQFHLSSVSILLYLLPSFAILSSLPRWLSRVFPLCFVMSWRAFLSFLALVASTMRLSVTSPSFWTGAQIDSISVALCSPLSVAGRWFPIVLCLRFCLASRLDIWFSNIGCRVPGPC